MDIIYRKLTVEQLDTFITMRISQLCEEGAKEEYDIAPNLRDYYRRHMDDGTFVSWIAMDGDIIIGTSGMSFVEKLPYFGCPTGKNNCIIVLGARKFRVLFCLQKLILGIL